MGELVRLRLIAPKPMADIKADLLPEPAKLESKEALYMAKIAEAAERYEDMTANMMRSVTELSGNDLSVEQRNLISVGYKNLMAARRTAWRVADTQVASEKDADVKAKAEEYKEKIAEELKQLVLEVKTKVVDKFVSGPLAATDAEVLVFFHKMEGDYNRYGAEITSGDEKQAFAAKAKDAYQKATDLCVEKVFDGTNYAKGKNQPLPTSGDKNEDQLPPTNPIRLGLALNYSVFMYEILEQREDASAVAKDAFDAAINKLDEVDEEQYRDSTLIMQLLKDNLSLWNEEEGDLGHEDMP